MEKEIYNKNNKNVRLDIFLSDYFENISRNKIKKLIISGKIKVNGLVVKPSLMLVSEERIYISDFELNEKNKIEKENIPFDIVYEDKSIIVVNKQSGMVVHPGIGNNNGTLLNALVYYSNSLSSQNQNRPGIVHRLDKDTSGLIIIAKTDEAHFKLSEQFANRTIKKTYRTIIWGDISDKGEIEGFISRDNKNRTSFKLSENIGKYSFSKFKKINSISPFSYLEVYPSTGRTHQIRVHLSHLGYPILMDEQYGGGKNKIKAFHQKYDKIIKEVFKYISRTTLHAYGITIKHPENNEIMTFNAPIPEDMQKVLNLYND